MRGRGLTLAVAESLTGGLVMAALTDVPGASAVLRGGPVVYATDTKVSELGVDAQLLASQGPVNPHVAEAMAAGVRARWQADLGLATTGVAGPERQAGRPVGEVYLGVADATGARSLSCSLDKVGDRSAIRREAARQALIALAAHLGVAGEASAG
jgi:nicotinamide-nucleotide amidase